MVRNGFHGGEVVHRRTGVLVRNGFHGGEVVHRRTGVLARMYVHFFAVSVDGLNWCPGHQRMQVCT